MPCHAKRPLRTIQSLPSRAWPVSDVPVWRWWRMIVVRKRRNPSRKKHNLFVEKQLKHPPKGNYITVDTLNYFPATRQWWLCGASSVWAAMTSSCHAYAYTDTWLRPKWVRGTAGATTISMFYDTWCCGTRTPAIRPVVVVALMIFHGTLIRTVARYHGTVNRKWVWPRVNRILLYHAH